MTGRNGLGLEWDVLDLLRAAAELNIDEQAAQNEVPAVEVGQVAR